MEQVWPVTLPTKGLLVTVYPVTDEPPSVAGGAHDIVA